MSAPSIYSVTFESETQAPETVRGERRAASAPTLVGRCARRSNGSRRGTATGCGGAPRTWGDDGRGARRRKGCRGLSSLTTTLPERECRRPILAPRASLVCPGRAIPCDHASASRPTPEGRGRCRRRGRPDRAPRALEIAARFPQRSPPVVQRCEKKRKDPPRACTRVLVPRGRFSNVPQWPHLDVR